MANQGLEVTGTLLEVFRSHGIGPAVAADLDPQAGLIKYIDMAEHEIVFAIYSLASQSIADALIRAHGRGVAMRGIGDSKQWAGHYAMNDTVVAAGIDLVRAIKQFHCMHLKVLVADGHIICEGSFNWSRTAEENNDECLFVLDSVPAAQVMIEQIDAARAENTKLLKQQITSMGTDIRYNR